MYSIEQALSVLGIKCKDEGVMRGNMKSWFAMYQGRYKPYDVVRTNGGRKRQEHRMNLMLEKMVCEAKANLLLNEKYRIIVEDNCVAQAVLDEVLESNSFTDNINTFYELTCALGVGATFYTVAENGLTDIRYVDGFGVYPITVCNNEVIECAFINKDYIQDEVIYKITIHTVEDGNYVVRNVAFNATLGEQVTDNSVIEKRVYGTCPTFHIWRPTSMNHIDLNSSFGVSIFSTAIDVIDVANTIFGSYNWEFVAGKKRVMVSSKIMKPVFDNKDRKIATVFDAEDVVYQELGGSDEPFVKEINMTLRVDEHTKAISDQLNFLSVRTGFGNSYFTFDGLYGKAKTATEVVSKNQELIAAIQRDRLVIEKCLVGMAYAILQMNGFDLPKGSISMTWDDSVFEDESKFKTDVLLLTREGHINKVWGLKILLKISEEEARAIQETPIDDLIKEEKLKQMKLGIDAGVKIEEKDLVYNQRDKPDPQFYDDNDNGI